MWELCPFEIKIFPKYTSEAACQHNFFLFHGLKSCFFYSLKLNFICYLNRFFTFDYSLWDRGRHTFLWAKTNFNCSLFFTHWSSDREILFIHESFWNILFGSRHKHILKRVFLQIYSLFCSVCSRVLSLFT